MEHQNAANFSKAAEKPKPKLGLSPSKSPLTVACEVCDREFSNQRTCNIHKGKMHKQKQETNSLEGHFGRATEPTESRSVPCLEQGQASLDNEAIHGRRPDGGTGAVSVMRTQLIPGGQTDVADQRNRYVSPSSTPDEVDDRTTTSNCPSKRPRSVSPSRETRRIKTTTQQNEGCRQLLEEEPTCESTLVEQQLRGTDSTGLEPIARSASSSCNNTEGETPCLPPASIANDSS